MSYRLKEQDKVEEDIMRARAVEVLIGLEMSFVSPRYAEFVRDLKDVANAHPLILRKLSLTTASIVHDLRKVDPLLFDPDEISLRAHQIATKTLDHEQVIRDFVQSCERKYSI